jgi:predicted RecA/RadA family phage recombinase
MTQLNFKVKNGLTVVGNADVSGSITAQGVTAPVTGNVTGNVTGTVSSLSNHTTSDLAEGTNKYYTDARVDARITNTKVITTIGYTPEDSANKGQPNGYASLDSSGLVPSSQLPSYVDDVLEYTNLAGFPGTGTTGKIYVALDSGKIYRWSGSAYVEISASPGSTDSVTEGTTNLYFTSGRARSSVSASGDLSYNSTTGVFSYTTPSTSGITEGSNLYYTDARSRAAISASGNLSYNSTTGVISYTLPTISYTSLSDKPSLFSGAYADLTGKPLLFSGSYTDLTNKPSLFSGAYADLTGKPSIPSTTSDISEGSNLYYTDSRSRAALSGGTGITYNSSTGAISIGQAVSTSSAVTFASVATGTIKAYDGTNAINLVNSTGEASFFGDVGYGGKLYSTASKSIRNGPNRATSYSSVSGGTADDILIAGIGSSGAPVSGLLITNSGLAAASTSGRRAGILVRDYGGLEYNGNASTTAPQGYFMGESSRGTAAEPRALNSNQPLAVFAGYSNAGSDLTSSNTPYWTAENYPTNPAFGLVATQNHRGPYGTGAANSTFTGTISGTTLTVATSPLIASISIGQEIKLGSGSAWSTTSNAYQIIAQLTSTETGGTLGGKGTYQLNVSPGTYSTTTSFYTTNTTLGTSFFANVQPQNTPITSSSRVQQVFSADGIILRAQSANPATTIFQVNSWPTTVYAGTGTGTANGNFVQGTNKTYLAISDQKTAFSNPVQFPSYTRTQAAALTGTAAGMMISISDSTGSGQAVNGMMAFWDTTNNHWSYVMDNSAV